MELNAPVAQPPSAVSLLTIGSATAEARDDELLGIGPERSAHASLATAISPSAT